jgi:hypothetical protein
VTTRFCRGTDSAVRRSRDAVSRKAYTPHPGISSRAPHAAAPVELLDKGIQLGLLLEEVGAGRACRFFLQGQAQGLYRPFWCR